MRKQETITPRLLRTKATAKYMSSSPWTIRKLVQDGKLRPVIEAPGSPWKFDIRDLDTFIDNHKETY